MLLLFLVHKYFHRADVFDFYVINNLVAFFTILISLDLGTLLISLPIPCSLESLTSLGRMPEIQTIKCESELAAFHTKCTRISVYFYS